MQALGDILAGIPAFAGSGERVQALLLGASALKRVWVREPIYASEPDQRYVYYMVAGRAKQVMRLSGGELFLRLIRPGEMFGLEWWVGADPQPEAIALEPCSVAQIQSDALRAAIEAYPPAGLALIKQTLMSDHLKLERLRDMATLALPQRLVSFLIFLGSQYGIPREDGSVVIDVGLTHRDIAVSVGTSRETATTLLNELKNEGLLEIGRWNLTLLDPQQMVSRHAARYFPRATPSWLSTDGPNRGGGIPGNPGSQDGHASRDGQMGHDGVHPTSKRAKADTGGD
ncbi:MAG TPA: Crp/Fnr family transcriptional regulator [bacterium]|nr:Crp/Fnr family transcriptional regulator [bacterium]